MQFEYDDGGRQAAGFKGQTSDCVTRAIAIACEMQYRDAYELVNSYGRQENTRRNKSSARTGVHKPTTRKILADLGWQWTPTMRIGEGCRVHLRTDELPTGRIIVQLSRHVAAVIDGALHDSHDSSRNGTRCVYGYWSLTN